jgi:peptide/nickel transport system substrate-binding protein
MKARLRTSFSRYASTLMLILLLSTSVAAKGNEAKSCKDFSVLLPAPLSLPHPLMRSDIASRYLSHAVNWPLFRANANWEFECALCAFLPQKDQNHVQIISQNGQKRKHVQWRLDSQAKWANGNQITAWDVRFSLQVYKAFVDEGLVLGSTDVETIIVNDRDALEFVSVHTELKADHWQDLSFPILPAVIEEPLWEQSAKNTKAYLRASRYTTHPTDAALYSGAFIPVEISFDNLRLQANPHFATNLQNQDRCGIIARGAKQLSDANRLDVDVVVESWFAEDPTLSIESIFPAKDWRPIEVASGTLEVLAFNLRNPLLADRKVRKAIALLLDRDSWQGQGISTGEIANSFLPHARREDATDLRLTLEQDEKVARRLLEEARWKQDGGDALLRDQQAFKIDIVYPDAPAFRKDVARMVAKDLKRHGIEANFGSVRRSVFTQRVLPRMDYSDSVLLAIDFQPGYQLKGLLHSSAIPSNDNSYQGENVFAWHDNRLDEAVTALANTFDPKDKQKQMATIMQLYRDDQPFVPLFWLAQRAVVKADIGGFQLTGHDVPSSAYAHLWTRKTGSALSN